MRFYRCLLAGIFLLQSFLFNSSELFAADPLYLPAPGQMLGLSASFHPLMIEGLQYDPQKPFQFGFIIRPGDKKISDTQLKKEAMDLVRCFMAALTIPQGDMWVNLSPYEKDRIIPHDLASTRLGGDLLAQDYILKQLASSLIFPDGKVGEVFWQKVYAASMKQFGNTDIPINTFNKVWIVPAAAEVFVHNNTVVVTNSHLKVMMQEDYLATRRSENGKKSSDAVMRQVVLPVIEKEVNEGTYFAPLRQILNTAILAEWYKRHLKQSLVSRYYADQRKVAGIESPSVKEQIYKRYVMAYKQGVYNFIREDRIPGMHKIVPRKYFSGGLNVIISQLNEVTDPAGLSAASRSRFGGGKERLIEIGLSPANKAMSVESPEKFMADVRNQNPSWTYAMTRLGKQEEFMRPMDTDLIRGLINGHVRITKGWYKIYVGPKLGYKWVWEGRIAKNDTLGTPKGGIRYITASDLMDTSFGEVWNHFLTLNPSVEQAQAFVTQWLQEELEFLSTWGMTGKAAGLNLELGGAKGLVLKGGVVQGADGKPRFESWEVDGVSKQELLEINLLVAQHHARDLTEANAVGIDIDSPAPDMNTTPEIMEKYNETYLRVLTQRGADSFVWNGKRYDELYARLKAILEHIDKYTIFQNPLLEEAVHFGEEHPGLPMPWTGVFTGKRYERPIDPDDPSKGTVKMGGVRGRSEATGEGIVMVMKKFFEHTPGGYYGKTVAVQAFGNVGSLTAEAAAREGFYVRAISDYGISLVSSSEKGWTADQLQKIIDTMNKEKKSLRNIWIENPSGIFDGLFSRESSFIPQYPKNKTQESIAFNVIMGAKVDILVPAYKEEQITKDNYHVIKAHWIFEGANGPTTAEADALLAARGKVVVPDTLANAGGVLCSGLEMEQALRGREFTKEEVLTRMKTTLEAAVENTIAQSQGGSISVRQAFDRVGLNNLAKAKKLKAFRRADAAMAPNGGIDLNTAGMRIDQSGDEDSVWAAPSFKPGQGDQIKGFKPVFIKMRQVNVFLLLGLNSN